MRFECADVALARLATAGGENADHRVVAFDRNGDGGDAAGEDAFRGVFERERLAGGDDTVGDLVVEEIGAGVAEGAIDAELVAVAKKERGATRVDERNHPEENLVREGVDVQRAGDGEADVVQ